MEDATGSIDGGVAILGGFLLLAALLAILTPVKDPVPAPV
jgi:hypothetical protein